MVIAPDKKVLSLALDLLRGEPCALGNLITQLGITDREIGKEHIPNSHLSGSPLVVLHRKRISATKRKLRQYLMKIASDFVKTGEKIPTTNLWLRNSSGDGFFLAENPEKRIAEFFDPLNQNFIEFLQEKL